MAQPPRSSQRGLLRVELEQVLNSLVRRVNKFRKMLLSRGPRLVFV